MRENLREFFKDSIVRIVMAASVILILLQTILIAIFYSKLPPLIPFLNSQPWGEGRLYPASVVFAFPIILLTVFIANNLLSAAFYKSYTLIARIFSFNSLLFIILGFLAYVQIILLVF